MSLENHGVFQLLKEVTYTTQTFSKKETLKRPVSSLEGSITKLLTVELSGAVTRPLE